MSYNDWYCRQRFDLRSKIGAPPDGTPAERIRAMGALVNG